MNRRDFVRIAGTAGAGVALGGLGLLDCVGASHAPSMRGRVTELDERVIRDFAAGLHGALIRPSDSEYESARTIWNARFDRHPALIARCVDSADVQRSVEFARAESLLVAVRGGGHSFAGHSMCDGGLVIDLSPMKRLGVDSQQRVVSAEPGLLFSEIEPVTQQAGLAIVTGGCPFVGIGGFTLGGGEGSLNGKYGLSCDNLLSTDVVLADGRFVIASEEENSDLFWALRGGGGNFGVVSSFRFRAHSITSVIAGELSFDIAQADAVMRAFRAFAPTAPDELDASLEFGARQGGIVFTLSVFYAGDAVSAEPVLRELRGFAKSTSDTIAPVSYLAYKTPNGSSGGRFPSTARTAFLPDLPDEVIDAIVDVGARILPGGALMINHLHGAVIRVPLTATAFPLRQHGFDCFAAAAWLEPSQRDAVVGWVQSFYDAVRPHAVGAYVNMLTEDEADRVMPAYGPQYARLAIVKKKYDPNNFFRLNPNIAPEG